MAKRATPDDRVFPRARESIPVHLSIDEEHKKFDATIQTYDISLTGVFFASEFFLKPGTDLELDFKMPNDERPVRVSGTIVREVRLDDRRGSDHTVSGFAVHFTAYHADAKTVLASSFLIAELDEFIADYIERRSFSPKTEEERLRDVVVAWEVGKMELSGGELDLMRDSIRVDGQGRIKRRTGELPRSGKS